jgi:hypothetical protein
LSNTKIAGHTFRNYVKTANDCFSRFTAPPFSIYDLPTLSQKKA